MDLKIDGISWSEVEEAIWNQRRQPERHENDRFREDRQENVTQVNKNIFREGFDFQDKGEKYCPTESMVAGS